MSNNLNENDKAKEMEIFNNGLTDRFDLSARPILTIDVEQYESLLDESGLSDDQKEEFLRAIWSVVVTFVELGFGVHPLQEVCGQDSGDCPRSPKDSFDQVRSNKSEKTRKERDSAPSGGAELE